MTRGGPVKTENSICMTELSLPKILSAMRTRQFELSPGGAPVARVRGCRRGSQRTTIESTEGTAVDGEGGVMTIRSSFIARLMPVLAIVSAIGLTSAAFAGSLTTPAGPPLGTAGQQFGPQVQSGPAGPPPIGAAGPPQYGPGNPYGPAGPPPIGAAGPPPIGAAGPSPLDAAGPPPTAPEVPSGSPAQQ